MCSLKNMDVFLEKMFFLMTNVLNYLSTCLWSYGNHLLSRNETMFPRICTCSFRNMDVFPWDKCGKLTLDKWLCSLGIWLCSSKKCNILIETIVFPKNLILKKIHPCYQGDACVLQRTWLFSPKKCNNVLEDMVIFSLKL